MLSVWTQGSKDKESLELALRNQVSSTIVKRFLEIVDQQLKELTRYNGSDFDVPNWANYEAYRQGRVTELQRIKDLFQF